ncbi:hypothetical protein CROQUDRAFT_47320 [Cronartium quercuum f. sp. fusiforme G11]|uniref:Uncharacterized protein n=1 Tax=Cronartium quercuum f. sp. fusiforme G11 TaxID=708437 RepID=A0A9P6NHS3_9BASI|nr:hypothetical protein CROQUDRAFT_47320 [Cronartium quercuum f. sp. fusiforme G11]
MIINFLPCTIWKQVFVDLYVNLLVKLQVLLKIIVAGGQSDACRTSIISLTSPLKAVLSVFINAGVDVHAMIGARVDLDLLASIGVSLGINANIGAGAILGSGINSKTNVGAKAIVGSGSSAKATAAVSASTDVSAKFDLCANLMVKLGPSFEDACKTKNTNVIINGLVDLKASIVDLGAKVNVGVGVWVFVNLYVQLMVKLQVLLKTISAGGQADSCRDSILSLDAPLKVLLTVFINAGIDVHAAIGVHVNLDFLASIGISLGINAQVGAQVGQKAGSGFGGSNSKPNVGAGVTVGSGTSDDASGAVPASTDVSAKFDTCLNLMVKLGPSFKEACKTKNTNVIINGLADLKASIVDLGVKINAGISPFHQVFVDLYIQLLVKLQALLKIISAGGQIDSCRESILSLTDPLKVILDVFIKAGIDVRAAIGPHVNLNFFASIGIPVGIFGSLFDKVGSILGGLSKIF